MTSRRALGGGLALLGIGLVFAACASRDGAPALAKVVCPNGSGVSRARLQVTQLLPAECTGESPASHAALAEDVARRPQSAPSGVHPDTTFGWVWNTPAPTAPITGSPAIINPSYPSQSSSEALYVGTSKASGTNFYALTNLLTTPTTLWSFAATGGFDGSWVDIDTSNQVYALDTAGKLYCFLPTTGGTCSGWSAQSVSLGATTSLTSPWWNVDTNAVFVADDAGVVHKISSLNGTQLWQVNLNSFNPSTCPGGCATFAVRGTPVVYNKQIYVGNDGGAFFRITDPNSGTTAPTAVTGEWLCGSATSSAGCGAAWATLNSPTLDVSKSLLYVAANGQVFEYSTAGAFIPHHTPTVSLGTSGYGVYSSPLLDTTNDFLYVGYNNRLHKIAYPFGATPTDLSTVLAGAGADPTYPRASPLALTGEVVIGNGAGFHERYGCVGSTSGSHAPVLTGQTSSIGTSIDSSAVVDYSGGNFDFGFTNGASNGGVVELAQSAAWGCGPTGAASSCSESCGDAAMTAVCLPSGGCCSSTDCGTNPPAHGSYTCTSNVCSLTCNTNYYLCGAQCIANGSCCSTANCTGAQPNCPSTGTATTCTGTTGAGSVCPSIGGSCTTSTTTVTITLRYPNVSNITAIKGSLYSPTTTYTAPGGVTFTNNSKTVTGVGTAFVSGGQFVAGQSISADGVNYETITTVTSDTSITLSAKYMQPTTTVTTYYEGDCVSGQVCPTTQAFNVSTSGASCAAGTSANTSLPGTPSICHVSTTVNVPTGAYAINAYAVDTNNLDYASNANPNKILLTGIGDQTTPIVNLVRVYPVTTNGSDATCPLNLAVDSSGNVWSTNANPYQESSCSSPTRNLSKLSAASAYAPTVYGSATTGITGAPEFIAADNAGNVWVTAPTMASGIFKVTSSGAGTASTATCTTPRGIDDDPTQTPNGAFVACYGTNAAPPANGGREILELTSAGAVAKSAFLTDLSDQPVAIRFAHAESQNSSTVYTTDYRCDTDVYFNRLSNTATSEVTVSRVDGTLSNLSTFTASSSNDNPYGLASDGCGTVFNAARTTGDIRDFEVNAATPPAVVQDSDDYSAAAPAPFGLAVDDNYSFDFRPYGYCSSVAAVSPGNVYTSHSSSARVTRFNNSPQTALNDFIVGSTASPGPRGAVYDHATQFVWIANSNEATLSRVHRDLFLFANDVLDGMPSPSAGTACTATVASGTAITLTGNGFDTTTSANNTVLVSGYLATVTGAVANNGNASQPNSLTVTVPNATHAITGPIVVSNQSGNVVSLCTYVTN